jgi:ribosomal-protein-alanine N-acetyltransferase
MLAPVCLCEADWRDTLTLWHLSRQCFGPNAWSLLEIFFALSSRTVRLKARWSEQVVGFVIGDPRPHEHFAWIAALGVHPDFQRRGIGAQLLEAAEGRLATPRLRLTVRQNNLSAIALYQKFGYTTVTVYPRYYAGGEPGLLMEKNIAPFATAPTPRLAA